MAIVREDEWLARLIRYPAFRIDLTGAADTAEVPLASHIASRESTAMYYARVDTADVDTMRRLAALGFYVVDVNVTLGLDPLVAPTPAAPDDVEVSDCDDASAGAVLAIAGSAMRFSRFHLDPAIPIDVAHLIKREWIQSYVSGARGDSLMVARLGGRVVGFLAVLASNAVDCRVRIIDLIAVDQSARRRGVARALVAAFIARYQSSSDLLQVGTQIANTPSLALYLRMGFAIRASAYVLHLHTPAVMTAPA